MSRCAKANSNSWLRVTWLTMWSICSWMKRTLKDKPGTMSCSSKWRVLSTAISIAELFRNWWQVRLNSSRLKRIWLQNWRTGFKCFVPLFLKRYTSSLCKVSKNKSFLRFNKFSNSKVCQKTILVFNRGKKRQKHRFLNIFCPRK